MSILQTINSPKDLKGLSEDELNILAEEIRDFLVSSVSNTGGHLASNLGAVELTIAIHRAFNLPKDKLVFDVGHQCYVHKILTGRRDRMDTLRKLNGISGFPKPYESEYDCYVAGHASNSVSVGLGLAKADKMQNKDDYTVVLIGDGALTGGMAYEGLSNAGKSGTKLVVCFNDNGMSISKTVGGVNSFVTKMRISRGYFNAKDRAHKLLKDTRLEKTISRFFKWLKKLIYNANFFEDMGFTYLGPVDGHDIIATETLLNRAKALKKPCIVHIVTQKGKGYKFAEENPEAFHGAPSFDVETGSFDKKKKADFSATMGNILCNLAKKDDKICAITAAMESGCGLTEFAQNYHDRFFDVGIAEEHAMAFSSALAVGGMRPVFAVYSSFLQRAFDQMVHDTALMNSHVVVGVDRAGIVGADGETHNGFYDVNLIRMIPGFTLLSPSNYKELETAVNKAIYELQGPVAIRYPRGCEPDNLSDINTFDKDYEVIENNNSDTLIVSYGVEVSVCLNVCKDKFDLLKLNKISPLPDIKSTLEHYKTVLVVEETEQKGGVGEEIASLMADTDTKVKIKAINGFSPHGVPNEVLAMQGLDEKSLIEEL